MINAYWQPLDFGIHEGANWSRVIDTALPSGQDIVPTHQAQPTNATVYRVQERSIVVFATGSTVCSLANGTPMFCAGDEFLRTQGGNGNPFDLDSAKKSPRLIKGAKEIYFPGAPHGLTATHQIKSTLTCWTFWENLRKSSTAA
jgi:pullulanase/glycogen debranching enzyme